MTNLRWSFSQWETYNSCPARWKYKSVMKLPSSPPGPAAARGLELHDRVEKYITCQSEDVDPPNHNFGGKPPARVAEKYMPILLAYREHPNGDRWAERRLAFDDEWYLTGSKSPDAWCIAVLDAARYTDRTLHIGEWKSGQPKDTHADQRKMYALAGLRAWKADEVIVTTYYLEDTASPQRLVVKDSAEDKLKALWKGRVEQMQSDKILAPKPGDHCHWCDYSKKKGGPCQF